MDRKAIYKVGVMCMESIGFRVIYGKDKHNHYFGGKLGMCLYVRNVMNKHIKYLLLI